MASLQDHPLASIFPLMPDEELDRLADDIQANGLRDPIWLLDGKILDGRNRYRACRSIDYDHRVEHFRGGDPLSFVISRNLHRRHLDSSQRAMVAASIATAKIGKNPINHGTCKSANLPIITQPEAAKLLNVSTRSVGEAAKVKAEGVPELVKAVQNGEISASAAAKVAKLPKPVQKKAVKEGKVAELAKQSESEPIADPGEAFVSEVEILCRDMDKIASRMKSLKESPFSYAIHTDSAVSQVEAARKTLWQCRPSFECPYCVKSKKKDCQACRGTKRVKKSVKDAFGDAE